MIARVFRPTVLDVFEITNFQLGSAMSLYGIVAMISYFPGGPLGRPLRAARSDRGGAPDDGRRGRRLFHDSVARGGQWPLCVVGLLDDPALLGGPDPRDGGCGEEQRSRAGRSGCLDSGRGLVSALLGTAAAALFAVVLGGDADLASLDERARAMSTVILVFTGAVVVAAVVVVFWVREDWASSGNEGSVAGSQVPAREVFSWQRVPAVLGRPTLWLQALIVICAYVGYKTVGDFTLYARDAFGMNDVESASVGTAVIWLRPIAALGAGLLGDRFSNSRVLGASFLLMLVSSGAMGGGLLRGGSIPLFLFAVASTGTAIYALRGVYFAVFEEAAVPRAFTGTAVGLVSVVGYTPDIFMGPTIGFLTDRSPGATGHEHVFLVLAAFSAIGLVATWAFQASARRVARMTA